MVRGIRPILAPLCSFVDSICDFNVSWLAKIVTAEVEYVLCTAWQADQFAST